MQWSDILAEIQRSLKMPSTGGHFSDAELLRRANIGQRIACRETNCVQKTYSESASASTGTYNKQTDCLKILRITYDNKKLYGIAREQLDMMAVNGQITSPWQTDTDTDITNYIEDPNSFTLYPIPSESGKTIMTRYSYLAPDLANTTDIPFDSKAQLYDFHDMLANYVLWQCLLEDKDEFFKEHKSEWFRKLAALKEAMKDKPDELLTFDLMRRQKTTNNNPLPLWDR